MKRLWSQVAGIPLLNNEDESALGRLRGVFVHPETGQILAFLVGWTTVLAPRDISRWGSHCVWVRSSEDLVHPEEILRIREFGISRTFLNGKKVFTREGKRIGTLKDFSFDTTTDALITLETSKSFIFWEWAQRQFSAKDIFEITERAIVLNLESEQKEKVAEKATLSIAA